MPPRVVLNNLLIIYIKILCFILGLEIKMIGDFSSKMVGIAPFNAVGQIAMKNDLRNISKNILKDQTKIILESVMKSFSVIDLLYVNVVE